VLKAASKDKNRNHLNSLFLDGKNKRLVAIDGHRLHITEAPYLPDAEMLLAKQDAGLLLHCLKSLSSAYVKFGIRKEQSIHTTNSYLHVLNMGAWCYTKLSDLKFPPYERIIQDTSQASIYIKVNGEKLRMAMNTFAKQKVQKSTVKDGVDESNRLVRMEFTCDKLLLSNMATHELQGTIKAECPISIVRKNETNFGFNARYWVEALDDDGLVDCYFDDTLGPATVQTTRGVALIMPVRL
jgi:DNA polymerase III sliding clamp (beta) subunit (PCNA family)